MRHTKPSISEHTQANNTGLSNNTERDNVESSNVFTSTQRSPSPTLQAEKLVQSISNSHICPECEKQVVECDQKLRMLEEALKKATLLLTANDLYNMSKSETDMSISPATEADLTESDVLDFEFSFPFKELDLLMTNLNVDDNVWFSGKICRNNGTVLSHKIGKIER
jgi:hypothetical protein